jgi:hypothetical protein
LGVSRFRLCGLWLGLVPKGEALFSLPFFNADGGGDGAAAAAQPPDKAAALRPDHLVLDSFAVSL